MIIQCHPNILMWHSPSIQLCPSKPLYTGFLSVSYFLQFLWLPLNAPSPLLEYSFGAESGPILSLNASSFFLLTNCPAMLKVENSVKRCSVCSSVLGAAQDHLPYLEVDASVKNELTNFKLCRNHWGENLAAQQARLIPELQHVHEHLQLQDSTLNKSLWAGPGACPATTQLRAVGCLIL